MSIPQADGIPVYCAFTKLVKTASLKPHPRNPNKHPQEQIEIFAKVELWTKDGRHWKAQWVEVKP